MTPFERKSLTYVEIDLDHCSLTYGVAPCTAAIPTTGAIKCFNSLGTCQDRANFTNVPVMVRFGMRGVNYLPNTIECIPSMIGVNFTPATVSLGVDLGLRATLDVSFKDHPSSDFDGGIVWDKYLSERTYDPFKLGTFFGKFRARNPFLRGRAIRWITGYEGQTLVEMETRHFIIESFDGPKPDGTYSITGKDIFKLADGDRAQAPLLNQGFIVADITNVATAATLSPTGIGNAEYPASGTLAIGGKEIVTFTRSGDVLTLTRAQHNTVAVAHTAQEKCQVCLIYTGQKVSAIIRDLFVTYAGVDSAFIDLTAWDIEDTRYLGIVYTAIIANPTAVSDLVSELIKQAALVLWWNDIEEKIGFQVLRGVVPDEIIFNESNMIASSFNIEEQPDKRISQVWTFFAQINSLTTLDDEANYRSVALTVDLQAEADYGTPAIDKIFSRWIPVGGRAVALRLNDIQLGRYRDPPRVVNFELMRYNDSGVTLARGYNVGSWLLQDETGASIDVPVQVTRLNPTASKMRIEAEEILFIVPAFDLANRQITIDANINNFNLRTAHDSIYPPPQSGDVVTCTIESAVIVGSADVFLNAFEVGGWPSGVIINIVLHGRMQGCGGYGGKGAYNSGVGFINGEAGKFGGTAFFTTYPIVMSGAGEIFGGGGGGGGGGHGSLGFTVSISGGGGGGGRGQLPGNGGSIYSADFAGIPGSAGTSESVGIGGSGGADSGRGGDGGGAGAAGANGIAGAGGSGGVGGAAGTAIDGNSHITGGGSITVTGARIN
jgi:hypothetical protein